LGWVGHLVVSRGVAVNGKNGVRLAAGWDTEYVACRWSNGHELAGELMLLLP
jgi:hypothetical protein